MFRKLTCPILATIIVVSIAAGASAHQAELLGDVLTVPEIITADGAFHAEFTVLSTVDPVQLELIAATPVEPSGHLLVANFHEGLLTIPDAVVDGQSFWSQFEHNGGDILTLRSFRPAPGVDTPRAPVQFPQWRRQLGYAYDIGVGANGDVWVIGTDPQPGGYGIYHVDGSGGFVVDGGALRIDVDLSGRPWVVNFDNEIYRLEDGSWERMPGFALDIGIGADGSVWAANLDGVYRWNGEDWINFGGSGSRIDVGPNGRPWVVGLSDRIYVLADDVWMQLPGEAGDIGVGADGSVWVIGLPDEDVFDFDELQGIYRWNGSDWDQVPGNGLDISVDADGQPWITNADGEIWRGL